MNTNTPLPLPTVNDVFQKSILLFLIFAITELSLVLLILILIKADHIMHHLLIKSTIHNIGDRRIYHILAYFLWGIMKAIKVQYKQLNKSPRFLINMLLITSMLVWISDFIPKNFDAIKQHPQMLDAIMKDFDKIPYISMLRVTAVACSIAIWYIFRLGVVVLAPFFIFLSIFFQSSSAWLSSIPSRDKHDTHLPH